MKNMIRLGILAGVGYIVGKALVKTEVQESLVDFCEATYNLGRDLGKGIVEEIDNIKDKFSSEKEYTVSAEVNVEEHGSDIVVEEAKEEHNEDPTEEIASN